MTKKMIMSLIMGTMASAAMLTPAAEAKGKGMHFDKFHDFHLHHFMGWGMPYYLTDQGEGCGFYHWKWKRTGSVFWKTKYLVCVGLY